MKVLTKLFGQHGRALTLLMAFCSLLLVILSVILTQVWMLNACYLCMFQRFLFLVITPLPLLAWWRWRDRCTPVVLLLLVALVALGGMGVAGYQSWLQWFPELNLSCGAGNQNLMEQTVEWLGRLSPTMFMATGMCEDDNFKIFALSLANWSLLSFLGLFVGSLGLLWFRRAKGEKV